LVFGEEPALHGIESVRHNAADAVVEDRTREE
jgi:uncharacterized protein YegP (UPF0339 family)